MATTESGHAGYADRRSRWYQVQVHGGHFVYRLVKPVSFISVQEILLWNTKEHFVYLFIYVLTQLF